jgi:hypothetical protein
MDAPVDARWWWLLFPVWAAAVVIACAIAGANGKDKDE